MEPVIVFSHLKGADGIGFTLLELLLLEVSLLIYLFRQLYKTKPKTITRILMPVINIQLIVIFI